MITDPRFEGGLLRDGRARIERTGVAGCRREIRPLRHRRETTAAALRAPNDRDQ